MQYLKSLRTKELIEKEWLRNFKRSSINLEEHYQKEQNYPNRYIMNSTILRTKNE